MLPVTEPRDRTVPAATTEPEPAAVGMAGAVVFAVLVLVAVLWGGAATGPGDGLAAAPFVGRWDLRLQPGLAVAVAVASGVVVAGARLARTLRWPVLCAVAGVTSAAWAVALAAADGWDRLTSPLTTRFEYEPYAATIDSAPAFLDGFVESVPELPIHVKGHPPGATLVPWVLDRAGLDGAGWFAALVIAGWAAAVVAVLAATRSVAGEVAARRAAPALVLLPAAVWAATSADALFAGVLAVGIALAVHGRSTIAFAGGVVLGGGLLLTYGAVLALLLPAAVAWRRRRLDHLAATGAGVALVLVAAGLAGFWWLDGLEATRAEYWAGIASRRPAAYLTIAGNPAAVAVAAGPAVVAGLLARPNASVLALTALAAVLLADLSQMSRGEVERIWLPFVPWLAIVAPSGRGWLAAQAATGITVQAILRSPW